MLPAGIIASSAVGEVDAQYTPAEGSVPISTVAEFEAISTGTYHLTNNLDFSGKTYTDNIISNLVGTLDGCGYSITGITVNSTDSDAGIIGLVSGTVKNLVIGTSNAPAVVKSTGSGKTVGGLVAVAKTTTFTVENVKLYLQVNSTSTAAGIVGYCAVTSVLIKNCEVNGLIYCEGNDAAGVIGRIKNSGTVKIENCVNNATISLQGDAKRGAAGIVGSAENGPNIYNCVNNANVFTNGNYAGGILGYMSIKQGAGNSVVYGCVNNGKIQAMNTGKQSDGTYQTVPETRYAGIGGLVGGYKDFEESRENVITIDKCMNYGTVKTNGASAGAIMGKGVNPGDGAQCVTIVIKDTGNVGTVEYGNTNVEVGAFISIASTNSIARLSINNCFNLGTTNSAKAYAGVYNMAGDTTIGDASVSDFYYLDTAYTAAANTANVVVTNAAAYTSAQFASGEVAYTLGFNFGQTIGTDPYPVPGGLAVMMAGSSYVNLQKLSTKAGGAASGYIQTTDSDTQGKQKVRFIVAVDSKSIENVASAEMVITFKKAGATDVSYTLKNSEIKLFKSVRADGVLYLADDDCAILGATVTGIAAADWSSVQMTFAVKDGNGATIDLMSVTGTYFG